MSKFQGFGTFKGVFVPSILTIFGVIMYLRLGWVVGSVGLVGSIAVITFASAITFVTGLSIAATATNMRVGGGGAYYMISRSFGIEAGAAIGLPLYLAQSIGVSFYMAGFAEAVNNLFPHLDPVYVGLVSLCILAALAYLSANVALRTQLFIFTLIVASLVSFFFGSAPEAAVAQSAAPLVTQPFWVVFAVFFPAVTGIEAGISMSGDLKDPARSLPLGTILAVIAGYLVYLAIAVFLFILVPQSMLISDSLVMRKVAFFGQLIILGVWGASLSSALGALLGAPRTLQALARDRVIPGILGKGHGDADTPRAATLITLLIAIFGVILGDLNAIAPILSMFFLTSYGFLNLAAGIEGLIGNPSWRPQFRTPWWVSLAGALGCLLVMLMINAGATIVATLFVIVVYLAMKKRRMHAHWSDMRRSMLMALARYSIYQLERLKSDARSWEPNVLVLSGSPASRWYLIALAEAITQGKGFLTVATVLTKEDVDEQRKITLEKSIEDFLQKRDVTALVELHVADSAIQGAADLVNNYGIGPIIPNTVVLGDTEKRENYEEYVQLLMKIYRSKRNLIIVREGWESEKSKEKEATYAGLTGGRIDIWWGRQRQNAGLMLAVGWLIQSSRDWKGAKLCLNSTVESEEEQDSAKHYVANYLEQGRVTAEPKIFVCPQSEKDVFDSIRVHSADASLVLIGMRPPDADESVEDYTSYYQRIIARTQGMPLTAIVIVAEDLKFNKIFS